MSGNSTLTALLHRVRRRTLLQLILEQGSVALAFAFGGVILLLLAGTEVLEWYWPLLVLAVAFGIGMWRIRARVPSEYEVAQQIDTRLGFSDAVSTAVYFADGKPAIPAPPELIEAQRRSAESAAADADANIAAPLRMPRQAWACAALLLISAGLLIARYGFSGTLDLRRPLVRIPFDSFASAPSLIAQNKALPKRKLPRKLDSLPVPAEVNEENTAERQDARSEDEFKAQSIDSGETSGKEGKASQEMDPASKEGKDTDEAAGKGEAAAAGDDRSQKEGAAKSQGPQNDKSRAQGNNANPAQQPGDNSSLMDKMRDAMANMLARMKMSPRQGEMSRNNAASPQGAAQSAAQKQMGQKGAPAPGKPNGDAQSSSEEAGEQKGEGASKNMNAQGKMSEGGGEKQQQQEGKSGAGKQDGDKSARQAEQAAAMGKISELLGKRAQNVTGEVMVEVSSGKQRLKTDYVQKDAAHSESGGEINRDEVPPAYQEFVQQYFEEIRRPAPGKAKPGSEQK
ncbi:MAG: hypothetical protein LC126_30655 [Bryobacterales bacterium]|nr:hypothetical protein [Bryobacterales bacterium]